MSKWLVRFCISLFAVFVGIYISMPVQAQSCAGVTFLNESDYDLNESAICEVTTPWVNKGHRVYVFVTDEPVPTNEDDWFAIRDRIEGKDYMNFYDPAKDEFQKVAVAVEISTDTSQPWGQEFAFGSVLFGTPLDSDAQVQLIEGQMKNTVAAGDVNGAIINAFNNAYMLAYPPATATPLPRPIQPAVAVPTQVIVAGPTTNVSVDFGPVLKFLLWTLLAQIGRAHV